MIAGWLHDQDDAGCYSDFGRGEMYSALGNRVRRGDVTDEYARAVIAKSQVYLRTWMTTDIMSHDIADATDMMMDFGLVLRLPDAIHIAIARRLGSILVSTDARQVRAARTLGIKAINPLKLNENNV